MGTGQRFSSNRSKIALLTVGSLAAIAVVGYFAFFYPPESEQDVRGTIGGVKKYRASQIDEKDVQLGGQAAGNEQNHDVAAQQSDLTGNRTGDKTGDRTGYKTGDMTGSKTGEKAASAVTGSRTGDRTGYKTGDKTGDKSGF